MEKFSYEANGYNREEVNQFVNDVIKETEDMVAKYEQQESELKDLQEEMKHYKQLEASLKEAFTKEKSNQIITEAKKDASEIINDALVQAEKIEAQRKLLERNIEIFKKKLRLIIEQQQVIADKIDELEIEDK